MIRRRSLQLAALALVLAVLLWCAGPAHGQPVVVPVILSTVADLPASSTVPRLVSDGASSSDCVTGGGSTYVWCYWNGSAWAAFGDGGGGGGSGDVTAVGDCATGDCFQATTARHAFLSPVAGGVATFRAITEADVSDLSHTTDTDTTCLDAGVDCLFAASATEGGAATSVTEGAVTAHEAALTITEAQISDLGAYLLNIVEDTTPQLGGALDAQGNAITGLGDVTFQTGASGGTLRTGTSAADLFKLQAYDVDGGAYLSMLELDAGNVPVMSLLHVTEIDLDAGGAIRTGTLAGETALIQARDVDGAAWTTFATLTANDTPTFDLSALTTVGGAAIQTGVDDTGTDTLDDLSDNTATDLPYTPTTPADWTDPDPADVGDALDTLAADPRWTDARAPTDDSVDADAMADADHGDVSWSAGVATVDSGAVGLGELADDLGCAGSQDVRRNAADTGWECYTPSAGSGDVVGPASATDHAVARFDSATGKLLQNSTATIDDSGNVVVGGTLTTGKTITMGGTLSRTINLATGSDAGYLQYAAGGIVTLRGNRLELRAKGTTDTVTIGEAGGSTYALFASTGVTLNAQVNTPTTQTCADSGDGLAGSLTVTVSGVSNVRIVSSDADGCDLVISETSATDGQLLELELTSSAGGVVTLPDTAGTQNLSAAWTPGAGDSLTLRYNSTASEWRERARADI